MIYISLEIIIIIYNNNMETLKPIYNNIETLKPIIPEVIKCGFKNN